MNKAANPYLIGAFMLGSLVLLIAAVLIFGGGQFLKKKDQYVIYFDSALTGLKIGAPVTLQGVQIGSVTEIALEIDQNATHIIKPVVIDIDQDLMLNTSGQPFQFANNAEESQQKTQNLIDAGLKAQLKTQSLLTGLLYVEFNFHRDDEERKLSERRYKNLTELPSIQSTEDQIKNTADEVMLKLRKLPLEAIVNDLAATLKAIREIATSDDVKQNRLALNRTLAETQQLATDMNRNMVPLLENMNATIKEFRGITRQLNENTKPILQATEKTLNTANNLLLESKSSLNSVEVLTSPDAPLWQSLEALKAAAKSIKELTDYLEQHPEAVIYGKH